MREALVAGHVVKRGEIRRTWRRRWMTLYRDGALEYRVELARPLRGVIDLHDVQQVVRSKECVCKDDWPHAPPRWPRMCVENTMFALITEHRTYYLYTFTPRETFTWIAQLERLQFEIAHERATVPRPLSISLNDTQDVRLPAILARTFVEDLSAALASATESGTTATFGQASFTSRRNLLASAITETGVPYGSEQECTATVLHVQYCDQAAFRSITLNTTPVTVEGINFAGVLQVRRNDSDQPMDIYLPGEYTYDAGGASGTQANECLDARTAEFHTQLVAAEVAAIVQGASPASLHRLYEGLADVVRGSTGRILLHGWVHHQIQSALVHGSEPLSYASFLHEVVEGRHKGLHLDLHDAAHAHTRAYLDSRTDHDGQVPREFFAVLAKKGMRVAQQIGLTQFRLLQQLAAADGTEAVQSCNPVSAVFLGQAALQAALMCARVFAPEAAVGCWWWVTAAGDTATKRADENESAPEESSDTQQRVQENKEQGEQKKEVEKETNTERGGQILTVRCWASAFPTKGSDSQQEDTAVQTDLHIALQQHGGERQDVQGYEATSHFKKRGDIQLSFLAEDIETDSLNFAGAIHVTPAASGGDQRRIVVPGERTYDLAGRGSDTRASERVAASSAVFLTSVAACEALAAAFGANARALAELHDAFEAMNTAFHGRPTLGAWLHHQVRHAVLCDAAHDAQEALPPMSYPSFVRRTLDVSRLVPASHLLQYLTSLDLGQPQLPLAYLATCFKMENLGKVLPLQEARMLETLVREMES